MPAPVLPNIQFFRGNPTRMAIVVPCPANPLKQGATVDVTVGSTDCTMDHYLQIYDDKGVLLTSIKMTPANSGKDGTLSASIDLSGIGMTFQPGNTYFFRVYAINGAEVISHTIPFVAR